MFYEKMIKTIFLITTISLLAGCATKPKVEVPVVIEKPAKPPIKIEVISAEAPLFGIPGNQMSQAGTLPQGTLLDVTARQNEWYEVMMPTGNHAWLNAADVAVPAAYAAGQSEWKPIAGQSHLQIAADVLFLRAAGSITSPEVLALVKGTKLFVYDLKGDWYHVESPDKTEGWICRHFVEPFQGNDPLIGQRYKARGDTPMYSGASVKHENIGTLWALKKVTILNHQNDWVQVQMDNGPIGWVEFSQLKPLP